MQKTPETDSFFPLLSYQLLAKIRHPCPYDLEVVPTPRELLSQILVQHMYSQFYTVNSETFFIPNELENEFTQKPQCFIDTATGCESWERNFISFEK